MKKITMWQPFFPNQKKRKELKYFNAFAILLNLENFQGIILFLLAISVLKHALVGNIWDTYCFSVEFSHV